VLVRQLVGRGRGVRVPHSVSDSSAADLTLTFATRAYKRVDQFPVLLTMIAINEKEAEPMVDVIAAQIAQEVTSPMNVLQISD
jgi:hypothetical protein